MTDDLHVEIAGLEAEVTAQQAALRELEAEVAELERELETFRQRYDRLITPIAARLNAAREAVEELERRRYFERMMGEPQPVESAWKPPTNYIPVEEQYRRAWQQPHDDPIPPQRPLSDEGTDAKRLYRVLARMYHPDLAQDEADRERRNRLMAIINEAYSQGDVHTLELLADQPLDTSAELSLASFRLHSLEQTRADLTLRIERAERERAALIHSDLMRLKLEEKMAKRDLLREIAAQMEEEYWECMARLEELRRGV